MDREDVKVLVKKWWEIYNDDSFSYKKPLAANVGGKRATELKLVSKDLSDKEKRDLRPRVTTGVVKVHVS